MYYKRKETYSFTLPKEYKAYLAFKEKLNDADVTFLDEGGSLNQIITITTNARIDIDDEGNFKL